MAAVVEEMLEGLEYFIGVCDDAEVNCCEILQSDGAFITQRRQHELNSHAC
tara:strand:+ start:711 stop:863 length:153 start_codon:yes stop_codon:yes gene_type:complete